MQGNSDSYFDGSVLGNFGMSLLAGLITVCTLGICYPWAVAMYEGWRAGHTVINGHRLAFDGTGPQLFGRYILWWLLSLITVGIYGIFVVPVRMEQWKAKHTYFAN